MQKSVCPIYIHIFLCCQHRRQSCRSLKLVHSPTLVLDTPNRPSLTPVSVPVRQENTVYLISDLTLTNSLVAFEMFTQALVKHVSGP